MRRKKKEMKNNYQSLIPRHVDCPEMKAINLEREQMIIVDNNYCRLKKVKNIPNSKLEDVENLK